MLAGIALRSFKTIESISPLEQYKFLLQAVDTLKVCTSTPHTVQALNSVQFN